MRRSRFDKSRLDPGDWPGLEGAMLGEESAKVPEVSRAQVWKRVLISPWGIWTIFRFASRGGGGLGREFPELIICGSRFRIGSFMLQWTEIILIAIVTEKLSKLIFLCCVYFRAGCSSGVMACQWGLFCVYVSTWHQVLAVRSSF